MCFRTSWARRGTPIQVLKCGDSRALWLKPPKNSFTAPLVILIMLMLVSFHKHGFVGCARGIGCCSCQHLAPYCSVAGPWCSCGSLRCEKENKDVNTEETGRLFKDFSIFKDVHSELNFLYWQMPEKLVHLRQKDTKPTINWSNPIWD